MGRFNTYFKNGLKWIPIHRPGPVAALVEGASMLLDTAREEILWLRDQFLPDRCDVRYMDRFAASRGITRFDYETEQQYYDRVRTAYDWHLQGGRDGSLRWILRDGCGLAEDDIEIVNLRDEDPARWAEFDVRLQNIQGDALVGLPAVNWAIAEVKPARSKFAGLRMHIDLEPATLYHAAGGPLIAEYTTVYPFGVGRIEMAPATLFHAACGPVIGEHAIIYPQE